MSNSPPRAREKSVSAGRGPWTSRPSRARRFDGGDDLLLLLVAEEPVLPGVRIEPAHGDLRPRHAEKRHRLLGEPDDAPHAVARHQVGDAAERDVRRDVDHAELLAHQQHGEVGRRRQLGEDLRVPGVCDAGRGERFLVHRGGHDAVDLARLAQSDRRLDIGIGGAPRLGAHRAAGQAGGVHVGQVEAFERSRRERAVADPLDRVRVAAGTGGSPASPP